MSDYWISTNSPVHLFKRVYESAQVAAALVENSMIDPAILAQEHRMTTSSVMAYQRRLGVRRITTHADYLPRQS